MNSIWSETAKHKSFAPLEGTKSTDVLIIGGGIAGILCAYRLKHAGVDCILVEADEICSGITKDTTAKITLSHGLLYDKMIRRFGEEKAKLYAEAQNKAIKEYTHLSRDIDCNFERKAVKKVEKRLEAQINKRF